MGLRETGSLRLNPPEAVEGYLAEALALLDRTPTTEPERVALLPVLVTLLAQRQVTIEQTELAAGRLGMLGLPQQ